VRGAISWLLTKQDWNKSDLSLHPYQIAEEDFMSSDLVFLDQIAFPNYEPNYAYARGDALFYNYSQSSSGALTSAEAETLVKGGVAGAISTALATDFQSDPSFSYLFAESLGVGLDGSFEGSAKSETTIVSSFRVGAKQRFSFDFSVRSELQAKEIENPNVEDSRANSKIGFLVLDTTNPNRPKVLDYFGIRSKLISSKEIGELKFKGSSNNISSSDQNIDINGNNGTDAVIGELQGTYQLKRELKRDTNITIVKINESAVEFAGDTLIGNLGEGVIYGTISKDWLEGTDRDDKIYASLGKDRVEGNDGNDIIEGGYGNDVLDGGKGNDKINGGFDRDKLIGGKGDDTLVGGQGNDTLIGGDGSDFMTGGEGDDTFVFRQSDKGNYNDVITDFQIGFDKIEFKGWDNMNTNQWLDNMFTQGNVSSTPDGVVLSLFNENDRKWTLQLAGLTSDQIRPELFDFV
jgi:serralysin